MQCVPKTCHHIELGRFDFIVSLWRKQTEPQTVPTNSIWRPGLRPEVMYTSTGQSSCNNDTMCSLVSFSCAGKLVYHLTATVQTKPCKPSHPGSILLLFWHRLWTHRKTGQHKQVITINSQNERTTTAFFFNLYPLLLSTGQLNNLLAGPGRRDRWLS